MGKLTPSVLSIIDVFSYITRYPLFINFPSGELLFIEL